MLVESESGGPLPASQSATFLLGPRTVERMRSSLWGPFIRTLTSFLRVPPRGLITSLCPTSKAVTLGSGPEHVNSGAQMSDSLQQLTWRQRVTLTGPTSLYVSRRDPPLLLRDQQEGHVCTPGSGVSLEPTTLAPDLGRLASRAGETDACRLRASLWHPLRQPSAQRPRLSSARRNLGARSPRGPR